MPHYEPPVGFHFNVEFDVSAATNRDISFRDVAGLTMELETQSLVEGGENRFTHQLPGRAKYPDLSLKRGLLVDSGLKEWITDAIQNLQIRPATVWVQILNPDHEPLKTFTIMNAWPKKWVTSDLNAESSALVIETLDLSYQYFRVE